MHTPYISLSNRVLLRILPVTLSGPLGEFKTYALLNEASTVTLLDSSVAKMLGLRGVRDSLNLQWTNETTQVDNHSERVSLVISGSGEENYELQNVRTVNNLALPTQSVNGRRTQQSWTHLQQFEIPSLDSAQPTILLGQDNCHLIIAREIVEGPPNAPVLSRTKLGWVFHGNHSLVKDRMDSEFTFHTSTSDDLLHPRERILED